MQEYTNFPAMQIVIVGGRRSGKTTRLTQVANGSPILAATHARAEEIRRQFGVEAHCITDDFRGKSMGCPVVVDDAQACLEALLGRTAPGITVRAMTVEIMEPKQPEPEDDDSIRSVAREAVEMYRDENERLRTYLLAALGLACGCDYFNGPDRDCPIHGDEDATNPDHWRRPPVPVPLSTDPLPPF